MKNYFVLLFKVLAISFLCSLFAISLNTQNCPPGALSLPKGNTLYVYMPTSSDSSFPEYGAYGESTSPAEPFDVSDLDSGIGTTAQLRQRIFEKITDHYCEFNVRVTMTTSSPSPTESRWQIMAIGSDAETITGGYTLFGVAQAVDIGDNDAQDYARVYAGSFQTAYGGTGEALEGANSTLERWATAIAGTASHEAGHNYGLGHSDADPRPGSAEDAATNHILATGSTGLTGEIRAGVDRHFSDTSYEILGYNLGLNIKTLYNWDFVNPNDTDAYGLRLILLSEASSLTLAWFYNGTSSPWTNPTVIDTGSTETFQGDTYNVFHLEFTSGKSWSGGANGVAPPGVRFHVGATFSESDPVIVRNTELLDNSNNKLPLSPRLFGYDAGTTDTSTGDLALTFFNPNPADGPLILRELIVRRVPRMLDLDSMVEDAIPVGRNGLPINEISTQKIRKEIEIKDRLSIPIANLTDKRNVDFTYEPPKDCKKHHKLPVGAADVEVGELEYCQKGTALSLFPSTYVYVTATVVDPNARYWDPDQGRFVTGPLEYKVFYQFAGFKPDFNNNGIDDLIDIRTGTSEDENNNGIPDEAEKEPEPPCDLSIVVLLLIILIIIALFTLILVIVIIKRQR